MWGLVAATLPTSSGCDAFDCLPVSPTSPVTGLGGVDWFVHLNDIITGEQEFPLFDNWFKVSFAQVLAGYYSDPAADGSTDPSGPAFEIFPNIPGTGVDDAMPWSGLTYTLQPWVPIENWINGLMEDPDYSNFDFPAFEEFGLPNGVANVPTEDQIQRAIEILQQGFWDFENPRPRRPEAARITPRRRNGSTTSGRHSASIPATTRRVASFRPTSRR